MSLKYWRDYRMLHIVELALYLGPLLSFTFAELVITRPPKNATVLENKRFLMHCEASGPSDHAATGPPDMPRPRVKWYHNGNEMQRFGVNYRIWNTGALRFNEVKVADRGIYRCKAESGKESLFSDPAYLVVQAEVQIIKYTPESGKLIVQHNSDVSLTCWAAGIPGPKMQWRKNDESIIEPKLHGVQIRERWEAENSILSSVLVVSNLTSSTTFECEAVNQHIGGDTVRSKVFNVIVRPNEDTSKRSSGICVPYNGTRCLSVLGTRLTFFNTSHPTPHEHQEQMAAELLDHLLVVETKPILRERCNGYGEKLICNYVFPPCKNSTYLDPKPIPLCSESCTAVQDLLCYVQWPLIQRSDVSLKLPTCHTLPSKTEISVNCTNAEIFKRDVTEVTSHCYVKQGRWYNGTVNITKSGKPCQKWTSQKPQKHKRPPEVYPELENSENYCRNPGAEEESPWCYIDSNNPNERWELCDVLSCDTDNSKTADPGYMPPLSWYTILIIAIIGSVSFFALILIAIVCFHIISNKRQSGLSQNTHQEVLEIDIQKLPANMSYHIVDEPVRLNPKLQAYEYPRNDIIYIKDIGQGAFGRVFKAKAPNLTKHDETALVAVKMLKEDASEDLQADFEREASLMVEFDHPNIVKFLGVCAIGKPMCLLFEYMNKGDLNDYLRICSPEQYINIRRHNIEFSDNDLMRLGTIEQLDICRQIAAGMVYLSEKCYVHRDLATRNCLITDNLTVKISDFGLARSVHRLEYYKGSDNDAIPIRWMPLESILYNKFSVESDVWSYGVILWEIFSYALQPYYGMTHEEVVEFLKEGKNLICPENTPQPVYELMLKCWNRKPSNRPKFQSIYDALTALHGELTKLKVKEVTVV